MILGISILLSASICKYEKSKIDYCDKMVFLGSKVMVLLKTTNPETEKIFDLLNNSEKLKDIDLNNRKMLSPWQQNGEENEKIYDYINSIGKYDSQTQINEANEFCETFRILKDYYQQYYTTHYKIIYALGLGIGCLIAILLI